MYNDKIKKKITQKLENLEKYYSRLYKARNTKLEEIQNNPDLQSILERNFQLSIEACIDIGEMIISYFGYETPSENKDIFLILGKKGILPKAFSQKLAPAAGFRNILVHRYEEVDIKEIHAHLQEIEDFNKFSKYITKILSKMK